MLLLGEFLGYLIAIAVLITAMGPIVARAPNFGLALRIASGFWLGNSGDTPRRCFSVRAV